jgi:hypothetical protein
MSEDTNKSDTYEVTHDPITDVFTGGKGSEGDRVSTSETHEDGTTDTYAVDHDPISDFLTAGAGTTGDRISTTEKRDS